MSASKKKSMLTTDLRDWTERSINDKLRTLRSDILDCPLLVWNDFVSSLLTNEKISPSTQILEEFS